MAKFSADLTKGPTLDTSNPKRSLKDSLGWVVGAGFLFFLVTVAGTYVAPLFGRLTSSLTGGRVNTGGSGGITIDGDF